jgi:hypothetical protein
MRHDRICDAVYQPLNSHKLTKATSQETYTDELSTAFYETDQKGKTLKI